MGEKNDLSVRQFFRQGYKMITIIKGTISDLAVDAIFTIAPVPVGGPASTGCAGLKATDVIQAATPGEDLANDVTKLRLTTRKAMLKAEERDFHNIAFTLPGRGVAARNPQAAKVMISEIRCHLAHAGSIEKVVISVDDDTAFDSFWRVVRRDHIVCLGDSITHGYPYGPEASWVALSSKMVGLKLANQGINGDSTSGMLERFKHDVLSAAPAYVIIMGGANDVLMGRSIGRIQDNMKVMAASALAEGVCPVLGMPPPALPGGGFVPIALAGLLAEKMVTIGRWVRSYAEQERIPVMDFYTPMLEPETGMGNPHYYTDGAHPNQKGYRKLARAAAEVLILLKKGLF